MEKKQTHKTNKTGRNTMTKFRVNYPKLNNRGIPGTKNLQSKSGSIYFKSEKLAQDRIDELNDWYKKNGNYFMHGIKDYTILPV